MQVEAAATYLQPPDAARAADDAEHEEAVAAAKQCRLSHAVAALPLEPRSAGVAAADAEVGAEA